MLREVCIFRGLDLVLRRKTETHFISLQAVCALLFLQFSLMSHICVYEFIIKIITAIIIIKKFVILYKGVEICSNCTSVVV